MPHATDGGEEEVQDGRNDDQLIAQLFDPSNVSNSLDFLNRDLEVGEKADDAQDFEDISDGDLASEEDEDRPVAESTEPASAVSPDHDAPAEDEDLFGEEDNAFIFGEEEEPDGPSVDPKELSKPHKDESRITLPGISSAPTATRPQNGDLSDSPASNAQSPFAQGTSEATTPEPATDPAASAIKEEEEDEAVALQRALFARAGRRTSQDPPDAPETDLELFFSIWPSYDPEKTARFTELFPPPPGVFNWKQPVKPPKVLGIPKVTLDIAADTERSFRLTSTVPNAKVPIRSDFDQPNLIRATRPHVDDGASGDELELDIASEGEPVAGLSWKDIEIACTDWDVESTNSETTSARLRTPTSDNHGFPDVDMTDGEPPAKRPRLENYKSWLESGISPLFPSFDDPEATTQKLAKHIALDVNDSNLLIEQSAPRLLAKKRTIASIRAEAKDGLTKDLTRRYNISNDEAYELLKENHQHKVRSTLGSVMIEHSMPAVKLQYPFYKVKLEPKQLRSFHRPQFGGVRVGRELRFSKPKTVKKKHLRGKEPRDVFEKSEDLSMGDNSSGLLLEYSEESPMMISNFGMGNKIVNFYRRKDAQDSARPKEEIGETQVLLPQDRSPFANFGHVDPGELVPAVQNSMYRAPIFKHEGRSSDFLVICSTTSDQGNRFFLRNLENLHVVGQQFPSTDIPGEHSRKVTDAAKRRLKAISYRVWRKWSQRRGEPLTNAVVQAHLPGSDISQNRGKMREFMKYDKYQSIWVPKDSDIPPDSNELRTMIKPEDICLLDSMQAGVQYLNDLGLRRDDDVNDDDDEKEGTNIALQLAPWSTTKNFMNACQGKAMLQLHGEGDPTGRGEGFSFIKTSMKGGFRALGESIEERLDAKRLKENHGHSYNVAKQQKAYDESIRRIWRAQQESLSSKAEHSDLEGDIDDDTEELLNDRATTPRTGYGTPSVSRREDESASQFSRNSASGKNQTLIITRTQRDKFGNLEDVPITITDPRVISAYKRAKLKEKTASIDPTKIQKTGDKAYDALQMKAAEAELARIYKSNERREARQRAKGLLPSPSAVNSPGGDDADGDEPGTPHGGGPGTGKRGGRKKVNPEGTGRRCANCGQIGHIKTNKKLCPMLNGTMRPEDIHTGFGGGGAAAAGTAAAAAGGASSGQTPAADDTFDDTPETPGFPGMAALPGMEI